MMLMFCQDETGMEETCPPQDLPGSSTAPSRGQVEARWATEGMFPRLTEGDMGGGLLDRQTLSCQVSGRV